MENISYWINEENIICKVSESWDDNMDDMTWTNRAVSQNIVGKPLIDFICDDVTRMYVSSIIDLVRTIPHSAIRSYRCDTPTLKRHMRMIVTPEPDGTIKFIHELLRAEPMKRKIDFKTVVKPSKVALSKSGSLQGKQATVTFVRCSFCNHFCQPGQDVWKEPDEMAELKTVSSHVPVAYGICPNCLKGMPIQALH